MEQAIVILPEKNNRIEKVRKKYLPDYHKYEPHITLVYPFDVEEQNALNEHIQNCLKEFKPFQITLHGLGASAKDYFLYLLVEKGKEELIQLHKKLNSGILEGFKNPDMPDYIPHLTLGIFQGKTELHNVIKEISKLNLTFTTTSTQSSL
ncbi:MAG: 2'-5' RNA ligase family protein [Nanoarchaeota archaeon]